MDTTPRQQAVILKRRITRLTNQPDRYLSNNDNFLQIKFEIKLLILVLILSNKYLSRLLSMRESYLPLEIILLTLEEELRIKAIFIIHHFQHQIQAVGIFIQIIVLVVTITHTIVVIIIGL